MSSRSPRAAATASGRSRYRARPCASFPPDSRAAAPPPAPGRRTGYARSPRANRSLALQVAVRAAAAHLPATPPPSTPSSSLTSVLFAPVPGNIEEIAPCPRRDERIAGIARKEDTKLDAPPAHKEVCAEIPFVARGQLRACLQRRVAIAAAVDQPRTAVSVDQIHGLRAGRRFGDHGAASMPAGDTVRNRDQLRTALSANSSGRRPSSGGGKRHQPRSSRVIAGKRW